MLLRFALFLVINFGALAVGGIFTGKGVPSEWYQELNKAPWTPPGWVFGVTWSFIMIMLAVFMAKITKIGFHQPLFWVYILQLVLNIGWNPVFFYFHQMGFGLVIISILTVVVLSMMLLSYSSSNYLWLSPYFIWLLIATSLNYYSWAYN